MTPAKSKQETLAPTLFTDIFDSARLFSRNWIEKEFGSMLPAVNIKESPKDFSLEFAAPGFKKEDIKVSVDQNVLTVNAENKEEKNEENKKFTRREFAYNSFSRSFTLPESVNADKIDAKYENGILNLCIPKRETAKQLPKKEIKVA